MACSSPAIPAGGARPSSPLDRSSARSSRQQPNSLACEPRNQIIARGARFLPMRHPMSTKPGGLAWPCSAAGTWETRSHGSWAACRAWTRSAADGAIRSQAAEPGRKIRQVYRTQGPRGCSPYWLRSCGAPTPRPSAQQPGGRGRGRAPPLPRFPRPRLSRDAAGLRAGSGSRGGNLHPQGIRVLHSPARLDQSPQRQSARVPRGGAPFWELYNGEREVGITIHRVATALDAGDILLQETFPLDPAPAEDRSATSSATGGRCSARTASACSSGRRPDRQ